MSKASGSLPSGDPLHAPGLKRRSRKGGADARYFMPPAKDIVAGFHIEIRTIRKDATEEEAAALCRDLWAELEAWRAGRPKPVNYTFRWLIYRYKHDDRSPFHAKNPATQKNYGYELNAIDASIGHLRFDPQDGDLDSRVVGANVREWHEGWGCPVEQVDPATGRTVMVSSAPSRARHMIVMLRTIISYGVEIGAPGCKDLRAKLSAMKFSTPEARVKSPTYEQVCAFVDQAVAMGWKSQAIATLAQYELIERRTHIIGQWHGDVWKPGWVWDGVSPQWVIRYHQTKVGKVLREYDLRATQRLLGLMQDTPKERRTGPVIVCETTGKPWTKRYYAEIWREIATAAGLPDDVWSMDMRAGGATEADQIPEVTDRMFDDAGGWQDAKTKNRYRRQKQRNAQNVVDLRQIARNGTGNSQE